MTICVAVKSRDCLVFAADSTVTLDMPHPDGSRTVTVYDHADKVFNLRKGLPIAAMCAGLASFGSLSISTISKNLRVLLSTEADDNEYFIDPENYTMEQVAKLAREYFFDECFDKLDPKPLGSFQYLVGGYSSGEDTGEIWSFEIENGNCDDIKCEVDRDIDSDIVWGGQPDALNRLILGYDEGIYDAFADMGVPRELIPQIIDGIARYTQANLAIPAMPITDTIDLARFLAETTKQFVRFSFGSNSVGGVIDIAAITKHENFKWVNRKHFYPQALNPLETDHAQTRQAPPTALRPHA